MFSEHDDDGHDDIGDDNLGKHSEGLRIVLVKPERSPAMPAAAYASACFGQNKAATADGENESGVSTHGLPNPVVVSELKALWFYPLEFDEARQKDLTREEGSGLVDDDDQGRGKGRNRRGTEVGPCLRRDCEARHTHRTSYARISRIDIYIYIYIHTADVG